MVGSSKFAFSYYITGFLILLGVLLGRFICGFLCPFGWFQELLHKIPTKKISTKKLKGLTYIKYAVLLIMVVLLPALAVNDVGMGDPFFCKYLCPQGVLEGAIPLAAVDSGLRDALGALFSWKFGILIVTIVLSVLFYRPFCKWLCPLGAFYALLNKVSLLGMRVDKHKCISCGKCAKACKMDVDVTKSPDHTACGMSKDGKENEGSKETGIASLLAADPKTTDEASELHQKLMQQETAILSENNSLWEKVFMSADKGMAMIEDGGNYGDFLLTTIENSKDQFTDDELKLLKDGAEQIREIEGKLTVLELKFPDCGKKPSEGEMSVPAENGKPKENSDLMKFPSFEGKDLDGNEVKSSTLFAGNTVTVVNFWFTTCNPCVGELSDLEALNKSLSEKGGEVVGINSFTLDGDKTAISEAKDVLTKKGASYKNIWFESNSEAGKFTSGLYSYPTTYVVDKNGNIVGDPITGAITGKKQSEKLNELIDQAIANSKG